MADVNWPENLPCMLSGTLAENGIDPWVSDQPEIGAARRRKRFTRSLHSFTFEMRLTTAQKAVLMAFYEDTLDDGVKSFNWRHIWSDVTYEVRFSSRPSAEHVAAKFWTISVSLEEI